MVAKSWKAQMASLPAENTCVRIVITAVYSPVRFWAQLTPPATANNTGMLPSVQLLLSVIVSAQMKKRTGINMK